MKLFAVITIKRPVGFRGVGQFYDRFDRVSGEDTIAYLDAKHVFSVRSGGTFQKAGITGEYINAAEEYRVSAVWPR